MKVTMRNKDLQFLAQNMKSFAGIKGFKINYAASKNKRKLETELKDLAASVKDLQLLHCKMTGTGKNAKPVIENETYIMRDEVLFNKEYQEMLEIERDVELHMVKKDDAPGDINGTQMDCLLFFLDDEVKGPKKK